MGSVDNWTSTQIGDRQPGRLIAGRRPPDAVLRGRKRVSGLHGVKETEVTKDHGSSVKNDKQYEGLRKKGMSKSRAAAISNSPGASSRGGKSSGSSQSSRSSGSGSGGNQSQKKAAGRKGGKKSS
jgi:hypothetical protein